MENLNQKTINEVDKMSKMLRQEGKIDKEIFDWFSKEYRKHQVENGNRQRHEG